MLDAGTTLFASVMCIVVPFNGHAQGCWREVGNPMTLSQCNADHQWRQTGIDSDKIKFSCAPLRDQK